MLPEHLGEAVEATVHGGDPVAEAGEAAAGGGEGVGILVEAEHGHRCVALEQGLAVAAAAEGGVEHRARRDRGEHVDDLGDHHRLVVERRGVTGHHVAPANAASERSSMSAK